MSSVPGLVVCCGGHLGAAVIGLSLGGGGGGDDGGGGDSELGLRNGTS